MSEGGWDRGDGVKPQEESEFEPSRIDHPNDEFRLRLGGSSRAKLTQGHVCIGGLDTNDEEEAEDYYDGGMSSG